MGTVDSRGRGGGRVKLNTRRQIQEGDNADFEDQNEVSPYKETELQAIIQSKEPSLVQVEDNNLERTKE